MKMEVKIISKSYIKPSLPTPPHLKTYNISLLDQFLVPVQVPMILFYSNKDQILPNKDEMISRRSLLLKQALSETLTHFYPLAGKMKTSLSVDCNDEGVFYVEARANISLSEYFTKHDVTSQNSNLLPGQIGFSALVPPITVIQETTFACGSLAIGALGLHTIMDATAMASFLKAWAAIAACKSPVSVNFDGPSIFPQHDPFPKDAGMMAYMDPLRRTGKLATGRIVFEASAIASLKSQITPSLENPTRVEVVSAFLGERIMASLKARSKIDRPILLSHAVNLRRRASPPFPESSLGNFVWSAPTILSSHKEIKRNSLVCKMREAIRKIDSNFVKNIQGDGGFLMLYDKTKEICKAVERRVDYLFISSWCNFGLYDADFGWGRPSWVTYAVFSPPGDSILNTVILMDAKLEKGIEALVLLDEEEIDLLEKDKQLLAYASVNPCPLNL